MAASIFFSKVITYLIAFNVMALVYPIAGCIREFFRFGFIDGGNFIYQVAKAVLYSLLLNSATFFIAIWICFSLRNSAKAIAVTAVTTFVLSLYYFMAFFNSAVGVLQTLVVALGAGLGIWGVINLLEGYGQDNPASNAHVP